MMIVMTYLNQLILLINESKNIYLQKEGLKGSVYTTEMSCPGYYRN